MIQFIQNNTSKEIKFFDKQCDKVGAFLDKNPTANKVVLVTSHLFRAASMFGTMEYLALPLPVSCGLLLLPSLLYRSAIERFCIFRFTLPSLAGGVAIWAARAATVSLIAGTAFSSLGSFLVAGSGLLSLAGYLTFICSLSNSDVERYMQNTMKKSCCS